MISGSTKTFYMIAHPIHHVRTPEIINPVFEARGIDAIMVPVHFTPEDFKTGWEAIRRTQNLGGIVVSVPFKELAYELSDEVDEMARPLGAVNVVRRTGVGKLVATNLDGDGFLRGMLNGGHDAKGRKALVIGAGGAGKAISFALAGSGCASLRITDVNGDRATALVEDIRRRYGDLDVTVSDNALSDVDLVVNATPCGLHPETDPLPLDTDLLRPGMIVADIVMKPRDTPLLKAAVSAGCDVRYGAGMLDTQIDLMISYFGL
ncbi:shikimate dehydrogenase [Agrobacterium leguminum]|uniref:shikimate dehydrogenase family protein n=1 Tax=Rhizobiaceae TaxID=82115 RepID=UPI00148FB35A|nr:MULTISPECIES: shikimate dehydrogenase [Rhizobiaceae]MCZ7934790.1 shikimate dehydrogenase [Agrobacterium leguminum]MCZ7977265.1 shikimate dehydrogenase [Agrobacterium salinitolerans]NOV19259.1 shikimate dehydrogenase [Ensifer canadensis]NSX94082.1 shikimate dehydrogenase [Agrobacterium tumefaciens]NTA40609.1 shikimate dehydrogenase [Agrobacterium salinitolerans]